MDHKRGAEQKAYSGRGRPKKTDHRKKKKCQRRTGKPRKVVTNEERSSYERMRVREITIGVEELKSRIPYLQDRPKHVAKEKVLRLTMSYINYLRGFLSQKDAAVIEEPFDFEAEVEQVLKTEEKGKRGKTSQKNGGEQNLEDKNDSSSDDE